MDIQYDIIEESSCVLGSGEALGREIEKDDVDLLVDALDKDLNFFFDDEELAKDANDAVDEIEIANNIPLQTARKYVNQKEVLPIIYVQNMN